MTSLSVGIYQNRKILIAAKLISDEPELETDKLGKVDHEDPYHWFGKCIQPICETQIYFNCRLHQWHKENFGKSIIQR